MEMEQSYILARLMGGHKVIAIAVNSEVIRGLLHMREAAIMLGGGVSRTRRVKVQLYNSRELHTKVPKSRLVEMLPEEESKELQAIIYADGNRGTISFQTLEGKGKEITRGANSVLIDESDLNLALAFSLRIENAARRQAEREAEREAERKAEKEAGENGAA